MKPRTRILLALFLPGPLGLLLLFAFTLPSDQLWVLQPAIAARYLLAAWAVSLIPAAAYTVILELWLRAEIPFNGRTGTCVFSTVLGVAAGLVIHLTTAAPVILIGGLVGAILGWVLSGRRAATPTN